MNKSSSVLCSRGPDSATVLRLSRSGAAQHWNRGQRIASEPADLPPRALITLLSQHDENRAWYFDFDYCQRTILQDLFF